jgi:hypothetical protein
MTGDLMMKGLIVVYVLTAGLFAYEQNWPKCWYWLAAAQITGSVLLLR